MILRVPFSIKGKSQAPIQADDSLPPSHARRPLCRSRGARRLCRASARRICRAVGPRVRSKNGAILSVDLVLATGTGAATDPRTYARREGAAQARHKVVQHHWLPLDTVAPHRRCQEPGGTQECVSRAIRQDTICPQRPSSHPFTVACACIRILSMLKKFNGAWTVKVKIQ